MTKQKQKQNKRSYFDPIPFDLFINILSRLTIKSKAQCRCVSKLWSSIIRFPNYNQLFPIKSQPTQRLLFAVNDGSKLFFYSSPQPQNPDKDSSLVPTHHQTYLCKDFYKLHRPVGGLVCSQHIGNNHSWAVITNPITGEYVTTPKVTTEGIEGWIEEKAEYSLGYDPVDNQFKVLRITWFCSKPDNWYAKYHVLTLGTEHRNLLWRKIQCSAFHYPQNDNGICINGVVYYPAMIHNKKHTIVSFDVRSEKFSFINVDQELATNISKPYILINYKGKLGVDGKLLSRGCFSPPSALWVLEDAEKHIWSKHIYRKPHTLPSGMAGMTGSEEILLYPIYREMYPIYTQDPLFISYYNREKNIITRVSLEVPVVEESNYCEVYTFANFEEDLKLM